MFSFSFSSRGFEDGKWLSRKKNEKRGKMETQFSSYLWHCSVCVLVRKEWRILLLSLSTPTPKQLPVPLTSRLPINKFWYFFYLFFLSKVNSLRRINNEFRWTSIPLSPIPMTSFFEIKKCFFSNFCYALWVAHQPFVSLNVEAVF